MGHNFYIQAKILGILVATNFKLIQKNKPKNIKNQENSNFRAEVLKFFSKSSLVYFFTLVLGAKEKCKPSLNVSQIL